MDMDDLAPRKTPTFAIGKEDLSRYSIEDLDERVELLRAEINRCEELKRAKLNTRASADKLFKI